MSLQQKFQAVFKQPKDGKEEWDFRKFSGSTMDRDMQSGLKPMNNMPPGYDIGPDAFVKGFGGDTDPSGNVQSGLSKGFTKLPMKGTDDMYTNEHADVFYEDCGGFVERANVLDRA